MKYHIKGKGPVDLTQKDFIAQGGEGSIYARAQTAFKVYIDPQRMIPVSKIQELAALTHTHIIKPEEILLDAKNNPVGYTMQFVKDTYALCQLFTKAFRTRNNITPAMMLDLVRKLQDIVKHCHDNKILIVDLNELNFISSNDFKDIYAIDVDSYQTPHFPATAIMDSIRDRHNKTFNEGTDWFSFAVTAFQMFIGIHPYKGKHPIVKSIDDRMLKNISAFNKDVSLPGACYPFTVIPDVYKHWFKAVLDDGKRVAPPGDLNAVINLVQTIKKIVGSDNFDIQDLEVLPSSIIEALYHGALKVFLTTEGLHINRSFIKDVSSNSEIIFTTKNNSVIAATIERAMLKLFDATKQQVLTTMVAATELMKYDNRLYLKSGSNILELQLMELTNNIIPTTKIVGQCLERATNFFDGVVVQNMLGSYYISIFPQAGVHQQIRIKELDGYKIVDAKYDHNVLMVVGNIQGKYDKLIFRFDKNETGSYVYDIRIIKDISIPQINFVVLDSGICVHLNSDGEVEVFKDTKDSTSLKVIQDPAITDDMKLMKNGVKLIFSKDDKLYSMAMKTKA